MKTRLDKLWDEVIPADLPCPEPDPDTVRRRVNAALNAAPSERRSYMRQKLRIVLLAAAAAAVLAGSAMAVGTKLDMLQTFFQGDTSPGQEYVDSTVRSVSDENYTLSVDSLAADENNVYMIVTFTALNEEAKQFLFSDDFWGIDTFSLRVVTSEDDGDGAGSRPVSAGMGKLESPDENSRRFTLSVSIGRSFTALQIGSGYMDCAVEVPIETTAPSVTVEMGCSGVGIADTDTPIPGVITIDRVTLTPFTCRIECSHMPVTEGYETTPNLAFRMADGSVRTQTQMMVHKDGYRGEITEDDGECAYAQWIANYRFREVQDLEDIVSIIAFDTEYPLDGSVPIPLEHEPALDVFRVPAMEKLTESSGPSLPIRAVIEGLGGTCVWDSATGDVTCTLRGVTAVFHPGSDTVVVDGQPVTMKETPAVRGGVLAVSGLTCQDIWQFDYVIHWLGTPGDASQCEIEIVP